MNSLGNEVTLKVKEAIRSKLNEMKANSSNEIIDYIMLLVTTKKSTAELAKSIDFLMENNTSVFVKWLSEIIKNLQQVTVSTAVKDVSDNFEVSKNITTDIKRNHDETESDDVKLVSSEEKKDILFHSSDNEKNIQEINGKKKRLPELIITKDDVNKIVSTTEKLMKKKEKISFFPIESSKINSVKNDSKVISTVYKQNANTCEEDVDCKRKRPRISINSDNEDEKIVKRPIITVKEPFKPTAKDLPKQNVIKSMSKVVVVPPKSKKDIDKTQKKLFMHDLVVQRVDHQRGALALDTAFKYIQQQIGASDTDISIVKKWRDYAVEMLRSSKVPENKMSS